MKFTTDIRIIERTKNVHADSKSRAIIAFLLDSCTYEYLSLMEEQSMGLAAAEVTSGQHDIFETFENMY